MIDTVTDAMIDNDDATAIAEALKVNKTVTKLDLMDNVIDDNGAIALADMLKVNTTITELALRAN